MGKSYFLPLLIFLACGHASAQVAVGGTSDNFDQIFCLQWDASAEKYYDCPNSEEETWMENSYLSTQNDNINVEKGGNPEDDELKLKLQNKMNKKLINKALLARKVSEFNKNILLNS